MVFLDPTGKVKVSSADKADYEVAKSYLSTQPGGRAAFRLIESIKGKDEPTLKTNNIHDDSFDSKTNTINWDPKSGLDVAGEGGTTDWSGGTIQSPALGLFHEMGHAIQDNRNPTQYAQDAAQFDGQYDTKEEKRVVSKGETNLANGLDEPTRASHDGLNVVNVKGPTAKSP
jgi:hypothetical protein